MERKRSGMIFINRFPYIAFNTNGSIIYYFRSSILGLDVKKDSALNGEAS